ncbi:hypothetical protein ES332_A08G205600v1 [Gossypium tomentosum]|uniref:Uncharacterized protein n=1 Tax=Gossypium tomentosum TaxID=34277 RepID=A0A5D2PIE2_GOSTO|nr:hypothetical protein ES332_A08G205600v1 [Gossypium tomentosum]
MFFNQNLKNQSKFLPKTNHYSAPIISTCSNPQAFKAFGFLKNGSFGHVGSLREENEDVGNDQKMVLVKRAFFSMAETAITTLWPWKGWRL